MNVTIDQKDDILLTAVDVNNKTVPLPAGVIPVWAVNDGNLATLTVAPDGLSATLFPLGPLGDVSVSATATLPDGSVITGGTVISIMGNTPVKLVLTAQTPVAK